jgi:hypothetical protein
MVIPLPVFGPVLLVGGEGDGTLLGEGDAAKAYIEESKIMKRCVLLMAITVPGHMRR